MAQRRSRKRSRGNRVEAAGSRQLDGASWSDLDREFFDGAPPDDPAPPAEAPSFDDLLPTAQIERPRPRSPRWLAAISPAAWSRPRVALGLASVCCLLICLFAAVVAFGRHAPPKPAIEPARPGTGSGAVKSPGLSSTRPAGAAYGS
jgi:hypothetical protein